MPDIHRNTQITFEVKREKDTKFGIPAYSSNIPQVSERLANLALPVFMTATDSSIKIGTTFLWLGL